MAVWRITIKRLERHILVFLPKRDNLSRSLIPEQPATRAVTLLVHEQLRALRPRFRRIGRDVDPQFLPCALNYMT